MNDRHTKPIPDPSLRRLPAYLRLLEQIRDTEGQEWVSCTLLANRLGQEPTQIRKDLSYTGIVGRPKVGYLLDELITAIEDFLSWDNTTDAFLAGVGNLGRALLGYKGFGENGLSIIAGFDTDTEKIGQTIAGREILPLWKLPNLARRMHVVLGIITVPAPVAQEVADLMIAGGIKAIWNFAPVRLEVPETVVVENEHLSTSLAVLSGKLRASQEKKTETRRAVIRHAFRPPQTEE